MEIRTSWGMAWSWREKMRKREGERLRERERERERDHFCSHRPHVGVKIWTNGGKSGSGLHRSKIWQKREGKKLGFFFSPGPENQCARRTRTREINHCALRYERVVSASSTSFYQEAKKSSTVARTGSGYDTWSQIHAGIQIDGRAPHSPHCYGLMG